MPSPKKSQSNFSKGTVHPETDAVGNPDGREEMQDERIMAGRADLLRSRQVDLDKLMLRHDDLVCLLPQEGSSRRVLILFGICIRFARPSTWTNL